MTKTPMPEAYKLPKDCPYSVKGVKTFRGMEGTGFNATLLKNGAKVAFVIDEGNGGSLIFEWVNGGRHNFDGADAKAFVAYAKALPPMPEEFEGLGPMEMDAELLVSVLVSAFLTEKKVRGWCKTKTVIQVGEEIGTDSYRTYNVVWSEVLKPQLLAKFKGQEVRILNEEVA